MLAVIEVWGNQFTVKEWEIIDVKKLKNDIDSNISLEALLISDENDENIQIGTPFVKWSKIECRVLEQFKWEKVRVFKMKSKKRYARNKWFRPHLTKLEILKIA